MNGTSVKPVLDRWRLLDVVRVVGKTLIDPVQRIGPHFSRGCDGLVSKTRYLAARNAFHFSGCGQKMQLPGRGVTIAVV